MDEETRMVHVRMPVSLIKALDDLAKRSPRPASRSRLVVKAVRDSIRRERYLSAIKELAGSLTPEDVPHWKNEEAIDEWLSDNRAEDVKAFEDKWRT